MFVTNNFHIPCLEKPYERNILLRNTLEKPIAFKIRQSCQLSLKISSTIGIINEKSTKLIKIQYDIGFKKLVNNEVPKHFDIFIRSYDTNKNRIIYKWFKNEISQPNHLAHRFVITPKLGYISSTFVFDVPCKASILEPILFPCDNNENDNCKTAIQIDDGTEVANKIIEYPKELLYNNNINNLYQYDLYKNEKNIFDQFNETSYIVETKKITSNGILNAAFNYLFGNPRKENDDSIYSYVSSNKRYGFIC
ncbi:PapD-like domain-containing protein [Strongyloides ratti]|uniref:PapD-like domain-containing protein n=1 Tax=Strongyloides ratti TaxID=34506 RepID=A0A090MZP0_STRRB|nr:PapD-like domain-containing protein [Strongyloides ratti]CEF69269.1 PapD-like domain-containing protein [Strongyloides ratti]